ncbi:MAG: valine--tRNA ligase [Candidatus Peregrinibacteria bacterium]|nr:valine--tRNA ligase [Candidatus Peregrinibacteria bacterium]MDZ4245026.1 valine--tRNA ligase [Candidatus Gracilibacteria bacterium]
MELEKSYDAKKFEDSIYKQWEDSWAFTPKIDPAKKPFVISMPPPNATGQLHLGHATMLALQDIMVRFHRMKGDPTLWLPGTDHAAIATQSVVERKLQDEGIQNPRTELGREKLLEEIQKFVDISKDNIKNQTRKMGSSCDWSREKYTMDPELADAVYTVFKYMKEDGLIYRGYRSVNWDPNMQTTVADDEIERVNEKSKFYYFKYGPFTIGTARPETKFADKIVVVHPDDKRYQQYIGQEFEIEWINGLVKCRVIADECVDPEFGTGAMTITPAHSLIDFELSQKHEGIEVLQIIGFDGKMNDLCGDFVGMDIYECREAVVEKLDKKGLLVRIDNEYEHELAVNYRGKGVIEPQVMRQWFIDVNKKAIDWKGQKLSLKEVMQDTVKSKMINIIPDRFEKTYFHWIDNLRDWCISRQIWWGHRIPMWYELTKEQYDAYMAHPNQSSYLLDVIKVEDEGTFSLTQPTENSDTEFSVQDPDTLDTWFSAALWTFSTLGWPGKTEDLEYFHPTSVLETGYDILFFWVARMILMSTYALRHDGIPEEKCIPFENVYLHGMIRDRDGKKMSKSRPETCIDPLEVIEKYGTDAIRLSLIIGGTPGNDMNLYEEKIAGYRNFVNKIWNSARFVLMNVENINSTIDTDKLSTADKWILAETNEIIRQATQEIENYQFSNAGNKIYEFLWGLCCDWYIEMSKITKNEAVLMHVLTTVLKLLHPFTPYVTEALWTHLKESGYKPAETMLIISDWPTPNSDFDFMDEKQHTEIAIDIIKEIRRLRTENKVDPVRKIKVIISGGHHMEILREKSGVITMMANLKELEILDESQNIENAVSSILHGTNIDLPFADMIDPEQEKARLIKAKAELEKYITSLTSKLSNAGFTDKAPAEVIEKEKEKREEAEEKLSKVNSMLN